MLFKFLEEDHWLEQWGRRKSVEVERRHQEDCAREQVGRKCKRSRPPYEHERNVRTEKRKLLYGIPESNFKTL